MTAKFCFSQRSEDNLIGVHPDLIKVANRALELTAIDFGIIEGLRSVEKEREMVAEGKSQTMNSRHLTGHAIDFAAYIGNVLTWEEKYYNQIADAFLQAAAELKIPIIWGGSWVTLKDLDHIELNRAFYPDGPQPTA